MNYVNQSSYKASPYWRWWKFYNSQLPNQHMPMRENHDTFKKFSKPS